MVDKSHPTTPSHLRLVGSESDPLFNFTRKNESPNYKLRRVVAGTVAGAVLLAGFAGLEHVVSRSNTQSEATNLLRQEQRGDISLVIGELNKGGDFNSALDDVLSNLPPEVKDRFVPLRPSVAEALDQYTNTADNQDGSSDEFMPVGYILNDLGQYR